MQQQVASFAPALVAPSFIGHDPPLQQHDSIAQQASAFFWSPWAGVCAIPAANAISNKPRSIIRIVLFRGFILVLLFQKIVYRAPVHTPAAFRLSQTNVFSRQVSKSGKHNNEDG
jgi:hypothetical protein